MMAGVLETPFDVIVVRVAGIFDNFDLIGNEVLGIPLHHTLF